MDDGEYIEQMNIRHDIEVAEEEAYMEDKKRKENRTMTEKFIESMLHDLLKGCNIDDIIDEVYLFPDKNTYGLVVWTVDGSIFSIAIKKGGKR